MLCPHIPNIRQEDELCSHIRTRYAYSNANAGAGAREAAARLLPGREQLHGSEAASWRPTGAPFTTVRRADAKAVESAPLSSARVAARNASGARLRA